ncbi:hypothetical protein K435DRAFT_757689 [Dendrothele bispora CBS 962.96]|uniref:Uncharacterized protein n=1 Tax=Dendrothele bispora (strain CBS 962.96) TaxID=1314807 RepID=A0A4V4HF12_DENBC|nr:hypothetical protein K435DRAFT_757689 [Dendrothele bispora CBS 962.96]
MRFFASTIFTAIFAASSAVLVSAQEAARFGFVSVSPSTQVNVGDPITITYNSTSARAQPEFVDFYLQGQFSSGRPTPYFLIQRNEYDAEEGGANENKLLILDTTAPNVTQFGIQNWTLWAYVTYPQDGLLEIGGIASGLSYNA